MIKKRTQGDRVRLSAEQSAYYGVVYDASANHRGESFEQIMKRVFPGGLPAHKDPEGLKRKYRTAYELAR